VLMDTYTTEKHETENMCASVHINVQVMETKKKQRRGKITSSVMIQGGSNPSFFSESCLDSEYPTKLQ